MECIKTARGKMYKPTYTFVIYKCLKKDRRATRAGVFPLYLWPLFFEFVLKMRLLLVLLLALSRESEAPIDSITQLRGPISQRSISLQNVDIQQESPLDFWKLF